jgi:hypothetical protein
MPPPPRRRPHPQSGPLRVPTVAPPPPRSEAKRPWWRPNAVNVGVITAVIAAIGALVFNGVTARDANRQIELAQQGQITDRYSKAVEQLGSSSVDVRLGGVYALESVMRDSHDDQPTVIQILSAFVRTNIPRHPSSFPVMKGISGFYDPALPADIASAMLVLAGRDQRYDQGFQANYDNVNFSDYSLVQFSFRGAI